MLNSELKKELKKHGIAYWQIAEVVGVSDMSIQRWLRSDKDTRHQSEIITAFEQIKAERRVG